MPVIKLNETKRQVPHPSKPGLLKAGEEVEADALYIAQHTPLFRSGELEVIETEKPKKAPAKKKAKK